jgi:hypothetical protein
MQHIVYISQSWSNLNYQVNRQGMFTPSNTADLCISVAADRNEGKHINNRT